jgi:hypothetical protein
LALNSLDVEQGNERLGINLCDVVGTGETFVEIILPLDLPIVLVVTTLIVWEVDPPNFVKVKLMSVQPLRGISRADVDSWDVHDVTIKRLDVYN